MQGVLPAILNGPTISTTTTGRKKLQAWPWTKLDLSASPQAKMFAARFQLARIVFRNSWARRGSNAGPLDLQSNALPTAPQTREAAPR